MSLHINKFVDRVKAADSRGQRDVYLTLAEAKDLHADITKILVVINELRDRLEQEQTIEVQVNGGSF